LQRTRGNLSNYQGYCRLNKPEIIDELEPSKKVIVEDFRQAWHEAMIGETIPVAQIWQGLEGV
jgi:hypothetical protein